jgi:hypothetical protein
MGDSMEPLSARLARIGVCAPGVKWAEQFGTDCIKAYAAIQKEKYGGHALNHLGSRLILTLPVVERNDICSRLQEASDTLMYEIWGWRDSYDDALWRPHSCISEREDVIRALDLRKSEIYKGYTNKVCSILPIGLLEQLLRKFELLPKEERSKYRMGRY